jgi:hypothetical protein
MGDEIRIAVAVCRALPQNAIKMPQQGQRNGADGRHLANSIIENPDRRAFMLASPVKFGPRFR